MNRPSDSIKSWIIIIPLSLLLVACLAQGEWMLMPKPLGFFGWILYRVAFCVALPPRLVAIVFVPLKHGSHGPLAHWIVLAVLIPFYLKLLHLGWLRFTARRTLDAAAPPAPAAAGPDLIDRRQFLFGAAAGSLTLATGGVGGYAALVEPEKLQIRHYTIAIRDLPEDLAGLRLVHVSDTHYGPFVAMHTLERANELVNRLQGDLIVLTGDYCHRTKRSLRPGIGVLGGLRARLGVVAVLGNHDHWEGTRECYKAFDGIKVPLLDNRHIYLTSDGLVTGGKVPAAGRALCLAGVGDLWEDEVSFRKALGGVPVKTPRLMLGHNPDVAEMIDPALRVDLLLSGHTHGGQVALPLLGPPKVGEYGRKYLGGLCRGPACPVIVSRGVGMSGLPFRFGVPPEIGVITLTRA